MISKVLRIASTPLRCGIIYFVMLASLSGCSSLTPFLAAPTPVPVPQTTATPTPVPLATQTNLPAAADVRTLRIWLPPRFDPNAGTDSANLLKQRLADFAASHPRIKIEVRIKAEDGDNGLLNSLVVTNGAASKALPDLVALSRPDLETAVLEGLVHPIDGLSTMLNDKNWYPYASELGHIQNIGYGLPFAGDALVMIHRPGLQVNTWDEFLASKEQLAFPAGDPQSLTVVALYMSAGGKLVNDKGVPALEAEPLTEAFTLIQKAVAAKVLLPALVNVETGTQSFQAYHDGRATMAIGWAADGRDKTDAIQAVPGLDANKPYTFATGWVWALAGSDPEVQQVAAELAEYLIADDFAGSWLQGGGYLPTRLPQSTDVNTILEAAHTIPSDDVLSVLGPIIHQALTRLLNGDQVQPVVQSVMDQFK
jgi:ABC-type glycerol-3-phosphate transport system substrate-binding protein